MSSTPFPHTKCTFLENEDEDGSKNDNIHKSLKIPFSWIHLDKYWQYYFAYSGLYLARLIPKGSRFDFSRMQMLTRRKEVIVVLEKCT